MKKFEFKSRPITGEFVDRISSYMRKYAYDDAQAKTKGALLAQGSTLFSVCLPGSVRDYIDAMPALLAPFAERELSSFYVHNLPIAIPGVCGTSLSVDMHPARFIWGTERLGFVYEPSESCHRHCIVLKEECMPAVLGAAEEYIAKKKAADALDKEMWDYRQRVHQNIGANKTLYQLLAAWPEMLDIIKNTSYAGWVAAPVPQTSDTEEIQKLTMKFKEGKDGGVRANS